MTSEFSKKYFLLLKENNNILIIYTKFCYFLLCFPFKFELAKKPASKHLNSSNTTNFKNNLITQDSSHHSSYYYNKYPLKFQSMVSIATWLPQQILCGSLTVLSVFWYARDVRQNFPKHSNNPKLYFKAVTSFLGGVSKCNLIRLAWLHRQRFANVINYLLLYPKSYSQQQHGRKNFNVPHNLNYSKFKTNPHLHLIIYLIYALYAGMAIMSFLGHLRFTGETELSSPHNWTRFVHWTIHGWWDKMWEAAKFNFFLDSTYKTNHKTLQFLLTLMTTLGFYQRQMLSFYCDLLVLVTTLILWDAMNTFMANLDGAVMVQENPMERLINPLGIDLNSTFDKYKQLLQLTNMLNKAFGSQMTCLLAEAIVYYSTNLDQGFLELNVKDKDWARIARLLFFATSAITILSLSCSICHRIKGFKTWLAKTYYHHFLTDQNKHDYKFTVQMIINQTENDAISIKGSNIFPVTYSLLANMAGMIVTYFIICVQAGLK